MAEERARIARELHDVVAHAVSVMVLRKLNLRDRVQGVVIANETRLFDDRRRPNNRKERPAR